MSRSVLETKVLELNRNWCPIALRSVEWAFEKLCQGDVVCLDTDFQPYDMASWMKLPVYEGMDSVGTVHGQIRAPRVVRDQRFEGVPNPFENFSRQGILVRDEFTCQYCGGKFPVKELDMEHVFPRSRGGKMEWTNIVTSCKPCNGHKQDRTPAEAGMKLKRLPFRPSKLVMEYMKAGGKVYPEWVPFFKQKVGVLS